MKRTFAAAAFGAWTFASGAWQGVGAEAVTVETVTGRAPAVVVYASGASAAGVYVPGASAAEVYP